MGHKKNLNPKTDQILKLLESGKAKLYYSEDCGACHDQITNKMGIDFKTLENIKGAVNCKEKGYPPNIRGVPTWQNEFGDIKSGSMDVDVVIKFLSNKQSTNMKFGKVYSKLDQQPQYIGQTTYCSVNGGSLPWKYKQIANLSNELQHYQNIGPFLGTMSFGNPNTLGNGLVRGGPLNPSGVTSASAYIEGARLPRPGGPRNNMRMEGIHGAGSLLPPFKLDWNFKIGQFGKLQSSRKKRRSKRKSKKKSHKRSRRFSKRRNRKVSLKSKVKRKRSYKFGIVTPGTKNWNSSRKGMVGMEWVNPELRGAKGYNPNPALLYLPVPDSQKISIPQDIKINVPMQFTRNQLNNPIPPKSTSKFGKDPSLIQMEGPNIVGYEPNMNLYDGAGANTINWATGKTFRPKGKQLLKIQKTKQNPRGFLSNSNNIKEASRGFNTARSYTRKGLKYGNNLLYTRDSLQSDAKTLYQPTPPYMQEQVNGNYATFGKKKKKISPLLSHQFGGKVITLDSHGKITITRPSIKK